MFLIKIIVSWTILFTWCPSKAIYTPLETPHYSFNSLISWFHIHRRFFFTCCRRRFNWSSILDPVFLNWADNTTANKGSMKSATINLAGRGLSHLFCDLRLNKSLGLKCNFIPGHLNKIADQISRVPPIPSSPPDFDFFCQRSSQNWHIVNTSTWA